MKYLEKLEKMVEFKEGDVKQFVSPIETIAIKVVIEGLLREADELYNGCASSNYSELDTSLAEVSSGIDVIDGITNYINLWDGKAISRCYVSTWGTLIFEMVNPELEEPSEDITYWEFG